MKNKLLHIFGLVIFPISKGLVHYCIDDITTSDWWHHNIPSQPLIDDNSTFSQWHQNEMLKARFESK